MILDRLREKIDGINISYDILEASGEDRLGGRLYTHHFSEKPNDYYDVGAMRFPDNKIMKRKENPRTGFNFNTIEWLETFDTGTGLYDQALTETVLESLDFDMKAHWFCVKGGTQEVAKEMANRLQQKPEFNRQVTAIKAEKDGTMHLTIKHGEESQLETRDYFAVFNSTTLGALQRMDLTEAGLRYGTKQAIRSLGYGASCKVGIKFKSPWWEHAPYNINKGGMGKTDLPLRVCVYPSYNINTPKNESAVLLCSYTWSQDAQRIGSLISRSSPSSEDELKELLLQNLALLHSPEGTREQYEKTLKKITKEYETHYAYDWYSDPHTAGAFAYFGPGQFSKMWPEIIRPNGWLYLIGEAASAHHAWIVGALESAVRAAFQMLKTLNIQYMKNHGGKAYGPYVEAMELLDTDDGSPFGPLPEEMPDRQKDVPSGTETVDVPTRGKVLNFSAAEIYLSFCELAAERAEEESKQAA
ncbi:putative l-amino acid oxidase protein [Neofusicoccum parvum UCRNP2]|uniref:Putative l-amino acid oxidase protein n=1 Tax=Botryosphaeria parva (strain UCR-NP2) TaxID=1287680 RepID=R1EHB4_BOTPV|nr:putative l-amino acid oxidase protein [Neofusicoccum parvum UCRNP2]